MCDVELFENPQETAVKRKKKEEEKKSSHKSTQEKERQISTIQFLIPYFVSRFYSKKKRRKIEETETRAPPRFVFATAAGADDGNSRVC